jgi:Ca2+-binding RTX toxin-like protein
MASDSTESPQVTIPAYSVSSAGDVNGDGFDDLIVGAFGADPNGSSSGSSYVVFGRNFTGGVETQVGGDGDDTLTANQGPGAIDILIGGRGNDLLISDGGDDVLIGGQGDDMLAIVDVISAAPADWSAAPATTRCVWMAAD